MRTVEAAGLRPSQVVLEITERSDARLSQVVEDATRLRGLGFRLALDDVGAGNAGLEMLRELPVDFVKIDHTVIAAALDDTHAQAVLLAIIAYAGRAGAYVIAEGIESEQILSFVHNAEDLHLADGPPIKGGQGYLLGRADTRDLAPHRPARRSRLTAWSSRPVMPAARPRVRKPSRLASQGAAMTAPSRSQSARSEPRSANPPAATRTSGQRGLSESLE